MINVDDRDGIVTIRLEHGKASALDLELLVALAREVDLVSDSSARAVVLTGTGSIFSAGVDLFRMVDEGEPYVRQFLPALNEAIGKLFALPRPVVVAANGHAIAGGCILVAAGDVRLMAEGNGRIGAPELLVGVPFPAAALEVLRFAVPADRIQEIVYTGKTFHPEAALAKGLVDEVLAPERLLERAYEVAGRLAEIPPAAFAITKRQLRHPALERARAVAALTDDEALAVWAAPETHERIRHYLAQTVGKKT